MRNGQQRGGTDNTGSGSSLSSRRQERNLREKGRRMELKLLLARLLSLLPSLPFRVSTFDTLHQAVVYIKQLEEKLANLNTRKKELLLHQVEGTGSGHCSFDDSRQAVQVYIRDSGSVMEINLVGGSNSGISLHQVIRVVEDEGALVVSANYCRTTTNNIIYTIHSEAINGRIGIDTSTVMEHFNCDGATGRTEYLEK